MDTEAHRRFLEKSALRAAQKAIDRRGHAAFQKEDFRRIRIQTVEPWKRIVVLIIGAFFGIATVHGVQEAWSIWSVVLLAAIAASFLLIALIGRKKPIDSVVDAVGDVAVQRVLDAIF